MPIYEFHCQACRRDSEVLVRSAKWEGTPCPHCGSVKLEKKLSVFASSMAGETAA
jgi:putative FmdB family regulatory protein